jgi:hypothetical protein
MVAAVSSRREAKAWCAGDSGPEIVETELPIRYLGRDEPSTGGRPDIGAVA